MKKNDFVNLSIARSKIKRSFVIFSLISSYCLGSCGTSNNSTSQGIEIKFLVGSSLAEFCDRAAEKFNQTKPKLSSGKEYYLTCETEGSGDIVDRSISLANRYKTGQIKETDPQFPTLIALDGDIYQDILRQKMQSVFVGQKIVPANVDSSLIAFSPMVLMTSKELAKSIEKLDRPYSQLVNNKTFKDIDPNAPSIPIKYAHSAPTDSNSGLQTLIAQYADIAKKNPEELTVADVAKYQKEIKAIQDKVVRYGKSTSALVQSTIDNGLFWASIVSVYESSVIEANSQPNKTVEYSAIYPKATFTSNKRLIIMDAPWISAEEKEAAKAIDEYLRSSPIQTIAVELGLRPGTSGVPLGEKFTESFGVKANPTYESYRSPKFDVIEAMLQNWENITKKPSQVVLVVDKSGSMQGEKLARVQQTLLNYVNNLGAKDSLVSIYFSSDVGMPIAVTKADRDKAITAIGNLTADGGTRLYDSIVFARDWLNSNYKKDAINAIVVLTDGEDTDSTATLEVLETRLKQNNLKSDRTISIFTVGFGKDGEFDAETLTKIAQSSGGYYRKGDPDTIDRVMSDLQLEF